MYNEAQLRQAAEHLIHSHDSVHYPNLDLSQSYSVNTVPSIQHDYIISEDLLAGQRSNGRMSNVRRFFCLFVTFDLLFISLMWLICAMLNGENIMKALSEQIYHYDVHTSLFDVVLAAVFRFVVLLLFYAVINVNHWLCISISTTLTCAFLIGKVFVYNWPHTPQPAFDVLIVLMSFVLSWGEAWFLDFRVLPQETLARRYLITNHPTERAPLLRNYINGLPSIYTESVGNFYSPMGSPDGSLYRFDPTPVLGRFPPVKLTQEQIENYQQLANKILNDYESLKNCNWKLEKQIGDEIVHSLDVSKRKKILRIKTTLDISPRCLLEELFYKVESIPLWNPTLLEAQKVQVIDEQTDITYQLAADAAKGVVKSRDFVTFRHWRVCGDMGLGDDTKGFVIVNQCVEHPNVPKIDKYIRGEIVFGCFLLQEVPNEPNKCNCEWVIETDLKGWIPKYILDSVLPTSLLDYTKHLKLHISRLRETGKVT